MKRVALAALVAILIVPFAVPPASAADAGFAIGPPSIAVEFPVNGSSAASIYVTSGVDGDLVVGTEDIPFRVSPETVQISTGDEYREVELTFYGDASEAEGLYSGKITFLLYRSDTVAYGVKIDAEVTQLGTKGLGQRIVESLQANYVLIIVGLMVVVALFVGVLIGRRTRKQTT